MIADLESTDWARVENESDVPSPALLLYRERIEANLRRMVELVGDPSRLRPHIKTHKLPWIIERQAALGIVKCKAATIAEAEMAAASGARDVLLAQQPVGPNIRRFLELQRAFPEVQFSAIVDDRGALRAIADAAGSAGETVQLFLDLDVGQGRTGIAPGKEAFGLYLEMCTLPGVTAGGLHAYDGHLHQTDPAERSAACGEAYAQVENLRRQLEEARMPVRAVVAGGTPTFPMHARRTGIECSPGTCVLWDAGYETKVPDLQFQCAAALLTRVISRPAPDRICLDLGHKAVASEMPHPRAIFPSLPGAKAITHSEEHLVLQTPEPAPCGVGDVLYGIPWHVCPTVALHSEVWLVEAGRAAERLPVVARARRLSV